MSSDDPFGLLVALGLFMLAAGVGAGALWCVDKLTASWRAERERDRCQSCGKVLTYQPATRTYRLHCCRPRY